MSAKKIYRTARQEATRKALIAKVWTLARQYGMEREDLYDAIEAAVNRKPKSGVVIYKTNWTLRRSAAERSCGGQADGGKRVSLSSLKIWQLKQVLAAVFGSVKCEVRSLKQGNGRDGKDGEDERDGGARVIDYKDWKPARKKTQEGDDAAGL